MMSLYLMFLVYLLFLPLDNARSLFKFFDSNLGEPLPEKDYASNCDFYTPEDSRGSFANFMEAVYDVHFIAHFAGWWYKMMIIRDYKLAWLISFAFEVIEITFRHWLPNFWECWWDHVSVQVLTNLRSCSIFLDVML